MDKLSKTELYDDFEEEQILAEMAVHLADYPT